MSRFIVALLLRVTLQCVEAVVSSPALIPPVVPPALSDPPCEFNAEETVDVPVVDQNGGLLNYKICSPAEVADIAGQVQDSPDAYDFEAGVRASLTAKEIEAKEVALREKELQSALHAVEHGATLDLATPADDHCLFHALRRGGLLSDIPCKLTVKELRLIALNMASPEQVANAAIANGLTVDVYKKGMASNDWGDNLMVIAFARGFQRKISVITRTYARTYHPDGSEEAGVNTDALWIAHLVDLHYYGVKRAGDDSPAERHATRGTSFDVRKRQDNACAGRGKRRLIRKLSAIAGPSAVAGKQTCIMPVRKGKRRQHGGQGVEDAQEDAAHEPDEEEGAPPTQASHIARRDNAVLGGIRTGAARTGGICRGKHEDSALGVFAP